MASPAPDIDDPSNWVQAQDPASGREYWINKTTNETSWNPPQLVSTEGDGTEWEEAQDPSTGRAYYVNTETRRATWSRPELDALSAASSERFFRYVDKRGKEQGPFPESKLQEWYECLFLKYCFGLYHEIFILQVNLTYIYLFHEHSFVCFLIFF